MEPAFDELDAQLVENSERKNELIHLRVRFNEHHREDVMGRMTKADANVNVARFTDTFFYIVDRLEKDDLIDKC